MRNLPTGRTFNALTGEEVKQIILEDLRKRLDNCSELRNHLTFPVVAYRYQLAIRAYPRERQMGDLTGGAEVRQADPRTGEWVATEQEPLKVDLAVTSKTLDTPDQVRADLGMEIPDKRVSLMPVGPGHVEKIEPRRDVTVDDPAPGVDEPYKALENRLREQARNPQGSMGEPEDGGDRDAGMGVVSSASEELEPLALDVEPGPVPFAPPLYAPLNAQGAGPAGAIPPSTDHVYARSVTIDKSNSAGLEETMGRGATRPPISRGLELVPGGPENA